MKRGIHREIRGGEVGISLSIQGKKKRAGRSEFREEEKKKAEENRQGRLVSACRLYTVANQSKKGGHEGFRGDRDVHVFVQK